jgi:integrase
MATSKKSIKASNTTPQDPSTHPWKSVEAEEAAAGLRPGPPSYWEQWAELPPSEGGSEIDHAILGGLGFTSMRAEDEKYEDGAQHSTNGHIPYSPTDRIGRGKLMLPLAKNKMAPPVATVEDVGRLLETIRGLGEEKHLPGVHGFYATLVYTGLRRGEALGLRWLDVDLKRRLITVRHSYEGCTKSGRERLVPIPKELIPILEQHKLADP